VTIAEPLANGLLYGMSDIAVVVRCPEGEVPASITFLVDGRTTGVVTRPARKRSSGTREGRSPAAGRARLVDRTGRMSTDRVLTSGALLAKRCGSPRRRSIRVELSVSVVDAGGVPITRLAAGDFEVREAGRAQSPIEVRPRIGRCRSPSWSTSAAACTTSGRA
jgi:hypothetical protein